MGNKCKICGYRFKSRDEAICPECFTARQDDISCERYSNSEHSHRNSYSSGLRDTEESFVQKELREERRNSFARENFGERANAGLDLSDFNRRYDQSRFQRNDYYYENNKSGATLYNQPQQPQPQGSAYQRFIAQQQRKGYTPPASSRTTSGSGFTPAGQILAQKSTIPVQREMLQRYGTMNGPRTKKSGNSAAAIVFLVVIVFVFAFVISAVQNEERKSSSKGYNTTSRTTTTAATKKLNNTAPTTKKTYSMQLISQTFDQMNKDTLPKGLWERSSRRDGQDDKWRTITVTVRVSPGETWKKDDNTDAQISSVFLYSFTDASYNNQITTSSQLPKQDIKIQEGGTDVTFTLLTDTTAKYHTLRIYIKGKLHEYCTFNFESV